MSPMRNVGEEAAESSGGHPACSKSFPLLEQGVTLGSARLTVLGRQAFRGQTGREAWGRHLDLAGGRAQQEQHPLGSPRQS